MHVLERNVDVVQKGLTRLRLVALRVAARQEALVAPPDMDPRPVDPLRLLPGRGEDPPAHRTPGERDVRRGALVDALAQPVKESIGYGVRESVGICGDHDALLDEMLSHADPSMVGPSASTLR